MVRRERGHPVNWGDVREGDVLVWEEDELDPIPVYLVVGIKWRRDGGGTARELSLDTGELFASDRRADLPLDGVCCVLRQGEVVWGRLE